MVITLTPALVERMKACLLTVLAAFVLAVLTVLIGPRVGTDKYVIALVPTVLLSLTALFFVYISRDRWGLVRAPRALVFMYLAWLMICALFAAVWNTYPANLLVYLGLFFFPLAFLWVVDWQSWIQAKYTQLYSVLFGLHAGTGAYLLVAGLHILIEAVRPVEASVGLALVTSTLASFLAVALASTRLWLAALSVAVLVGVGLYATKVATPSIEPLLLIPLSELTTVMPFVTAEMLPIVVPVLAMVEEVMFRLPLLLFKEFGMYANAVAVTAIFAYLHVFTRLGLPLDEYVASLTAITAAGAVFTATFCCSLCILASSMAHIAYNLMVIMHVPTPLALAIHLATSIPTLLLRHRYVM